MANDVPVASPAVEVQQILVRWQQQSHSTGSTVRTWKIIRDTRSENFGHADLSDESSQLVRVSWEGDQWRLGGTSIAPSSLSEVALSLAPRENGNEEEFKRALSERFQRPTPFPKRIPYLFLSDSSEERHLWWPIGDLRPSAAAICPRGVSAACFERPLFSYLLEGEMLLAGLGVAPDSDDSLEYTLLPETKPIAGKFCRVLQVWKKRGMVPKLHREFWLETGDEIRLRRCRLFSPDEVLMHFEGASPSFPERVTILRWGGNGEIAEQLVAIVQAAETEKQKAGIQWDFTFPEGTLVADFIKGERRIVANDGSLRPITIDDLRLSTFDTVGRGFAKINLTNPLITTLIRWFAWPWVLVPLSGICLVWGVLSRMLSKGKAELSSGTESHYSGGGPNGG